MDWMAMTGSRESATTNDRSHRLLVAATVVLIATAVLGRILAGIAVGSFHLFWFRLYVPFYAVGLGWSLWTHRRTIPSIPTAGWLFVGFGIYVAASALWAVNTDGLLFGLFVLGSALGVAAAVYLTARDRRTVGLYLLTIFALVVVGEVVALWEIVTGAHLPTSRLLVEGFRERSKISKLGVGPATAWFYNRNGFGFFLGLAAGPLFAATLGSERRPAARALAFCILALAVVLLVNNGSRSALAMVALACGGVVALSKLRGRLRPRTPSRTDRWAVTAGVFGAALVAVVALVFVPNPFTGVPSLGVRWQLAVEGVRLLFRSNGLGVGVNSFSAANMALSGPIRAKLAPHNWLTNLLGEFGVVGTGLFLAAYARILYDVAAAYVVTDDWRCLGLFGAMVSFPFGALGPANVLYTHHGLWIFIGLAAAAAYRT